VVVDWDPRILWGRFGDHYMRHGEWCCRVDDSCAEIAAICNEQGLEAIFSDVAR
jgi:hypothetical protein